MKISVILEVTDVFSADTDTDCVILLIMPGDTDTAPSPGCLMSVVTGPDQLTTLTLTRCHSIITRRPAGLHSHQSPILLLLRCPL